MMKHILVRYNLPGGSLLKVRQLKQRLMDGCRMNMVIMSECNLALFVPDDMPAYHDLLYDLQQHTLLYTWQAIVMA